MENLRQMVKEVYETKFKVNFHKMSFKQDLEIFYNFYINYELFSTIRKMKKMAINAD